MSNLDNLVQRFTIGEVKFRRSGHADDKSFHGYTIEHRRPDAPDMRCTVGLTLCKREECGGARAHTLDQADPLTISPSLVCVSCGWHVFIRNGAIQVVSPAKPHVLLENAKDFPMWGDE